MIHDHAHPLAGTEVSVFMRFPNTENETCTLALEDWWDRVSGGSWMFAKGNPAAITYAARSGIVGLPIDDEVVYGKVNGMGHLVHVTEIVPEPSEEGTPEGPEEE